MIELQGFTWSLWRHDIWTFSALPAPLWEGPPIAAGFTSQKSNAQLWWILYCPLLNKSSSCRWFKTWPPCDITVKDCQLIVRRAGLLLSQQDFEWRWSVPLFQCLTVLEFSFILFDLCLLITFFNFIMNYVPIVTFWIFTYHKIWILSIMFCFIWSYWIIYFLACL